MPTYAGQCRTVPSSKKRHAAVVSVLREVTTLFGTIRTVRHCLARHCSGLFGIVSHYCALYRTTMSCTDRHRSKQVGMLLGMFGTARITVCPVRHCLALFGTIRHCSAYCLTLFGILFGTVRYQSALFGTIRHYSTYCLALLGTVWHTVWHCLVPFGIVWYHSALFDILFGTVRHCLVLFDCCCRDPFSTV